MSKTHVINSPRAARQGQLRLGCSAVLLDPAGTKVLLTRRKDNGMWCLPGGRVDPGESVTESIVREVSEETGLQVRVLRLTGIYSNPDLLVVYPDGNRSHIVVLNFLVEWVSGEIDLSDETTDARFFPILKALTMDLFHNHAEHLQDALSDQLSIMVK
jgi:8-oxo-dGTP pyrophosphatase MutT (NUDIX family)